MNDCNPNTNTTPNTIPAANSTVTLKMYTDEIAKLREGTDLKALCKVCNCRYKAITEHIRSKHPDQYLQAKSSGEKLYEKLKIECTFCGFHPSTANSLVNHINSYHIKGNPLLTPPATPVAATTAVATVPTPVTMPVVVTKTPAPIKATLAVKAPVQAPVITKTEPVVTLKAPLQLQVDAEEASDEPPALEPIKPTPVKSVNTAVTEKPAIIALKNKVTQVTEPITLNEIEQDNKKLTVSLKKPIEDTAQVLISSVDEKITPVTNSVTVTSLPTTNGKMNFNINIQLSISQA